MLDDAVRLCCVLRYKDEEASQESPPPPLLSLPDLPESAFADVATGLDGRSLCNLDVACRSLRDLSAGPQGPWRARGNAKFKGMALETECKFMMEFQCLAQRARDTDWKARYLRFAGGLPTFRAPYLGRVITRIDEPDKVVHCRCRCIVDCAEQPADIDVRIYFEFAIISNADNCSVCLVDFRDDGYSSIIFSPNTGAVIWEHIVKHTPVELERAYVRPLSSASADGRGFEGSVGLYINGGHVAFFRRRKGHWAGDWAGPPSTWQTTGYITDLRWAEGTCVTPCLAFGEAGVYHVRIVRLGHTPPVDPGDVPASYDETQWKYIGWKTRLAKPRVAQPRVAVEAYSICRQS